MQLTRDLFAIAKFLCCTVMKCQWSSSVAQTIDRQQVAEYIPILFAFLLLSAPRPENSSNVFNVRQKTDARYSYR